MTYSHSNPRARRPLIDRIADRVALAPNGCLVWLGSLNAYGYGQVRTGARADGTHSVRQVHRALYELVVGDVREGLELDHLCRNRACCLPNHLEPVTRLENVHRGESPSAKAWRRDTCLHGHPYDEANTYFHKGARVCRTCKRDQRRARLAAGGNR